MKRESVDELMKAAWEASGTAQFGEYAAFTVGFHSGFRACQQQVYDHGIQADKYVGSYDEHINAELTRLRKAYQALMDSANRDRATAFELTKQLELLESKLKAGT